VSREHFEIVLEDGGLLLVNLSSAGTLVNNKGIHDSVRVLSGDRIGIGCDPQGGGAPTLCFGLTAACDDASIEGDGFGFEGIEEMVIGGASHAGGEIATGVAAGCAAGEADTLDGDMLPAQVLPEVTPVGTTMPAGAMPVDCLGGTMPPVPSESDDPAKVPLASEPPRMLPTVVPFFGDSQASRQTTVDAHRLSAGVKDIDPGAHVSVTFRTAQAVFELADA